MTSRREQESATIIERLATLTCPACGAQSAEVMPLDACLFCFDCRSCGATLKPRAGHCCVFCSYGSIPCPPVQIATAAKRGVLLR